jgi:hypothetical protein
MARVARRRHPAHALPEDARGYFAEMGRIAVEIGDNAKCVVLEGDPRKAAQLRHDDDAMDDVHRHLFTVLMDREWTHGVATARRRHPAGPLLRTLRRGGGEICGSRTTQCPQFTGNPPYSIPSYSGGIGGVFGESCDSQRTGAHERGLTADLPENLTVGRHHGLLGG